MSRFSPRDLDADELAARLATLGIGDGVARRVFAAVHRPGAPDFGAVAGLRAEARRALQEHALFPDLEVLDRRRGADGFVKYLFRLPDGPVVEAVRIPLPDAAAARALKTRRDHGQAAPLESLPTAKYTVCISSQAGCALACDFCSTGRLGAIRSLRTAEMLAQVRHVIAEADHPVRGVVFMGMGEPFLNTARVLRAARVLSHPAAYGIAARAITICTAGVVPGIRRFTEEGRRFRLIVSLGAPTSAARVRLMPIERRWPLPELMAALRAYAATTTQRLTLAYVLIGGPEGNATPAHARELGALLAGLKVKLNLIDVSDPEGLYQPPTSVQLSAFRDALAPFGFPVVRRYSGGQDIAAGCGRLAGSTQGGALVPPPRKGPGAAVASGPQGAPGA